MRKIDALAFWRIVSIVLVAMLVVVVSLDFWNLRLWGDEVKYDRFGNWSDFISGIGALTAAIVALGTIVHPRTPREPGSPAGTSVRGTLDRFALRRVIGASSSLPAAWNARPHAAPHASGVCGRFTIAS